MIAKAFCNKFINVFIHFLKMRGGSLKNEMFLHPCIYPLVYMTISVSVSPCFSVSMHQCVRVSVCSSISSSIND